MSFRDERNRPARVAGSSVNQAWAKCFLSRCLTCPQGHWQSWACGSQAWPRCQCRSGACGAGEPTAPSRPIPLTWLIVIPVLRGCKSEQTQDSKCHNWPHKFSECTAL